MAVAIQGFSIRRYASKMRSVNVEKSWPFHIDNKEKMKKEELAAKLPSMKCPKYRWWKDEMEAMRSKSSNSSANKFDDDDDDKNGDKILEATEDDEKEKSIAGDKNGCVSGKLPVLVTGDEEKLVMSCPVCRSFTATTVNAVNAHIDDCLAETTSKVDQRKLEMRKSTETTAVTTKVKSKTRKRRSIMEIFAASPQIEAAKIDNETPPVVVPEEKVNLKVLKKTLFDVVGKEQQTEKKKKREKNKNCLRDDATRTTLKLKNMRKKKKKKMKIIDGGFVTTSSRTTSRVTPSEVMKKDKIHKSKVVSPVDFCGHEKVSLHDKRSRNETPYATVLHKKPSRMKSLAAQEKLKVVQTSKLPAKQPLQDPFPGHSTLKSCAEITLVQNNFSISSSLGDKMNCCPVEQSDSHVRFSGPTKMQYSSAECPQLHSLSRESSDIMAALPMKDSMETDTDLPSAVAALDGAGGNVSSRASSQSSRENTSLGRGHSNDSVMVIPSPRNKGCQDKEEYCRDRFVDLNQVSNDQLHMYHQVNSDESLSSASIPKVESTLTESLKPNSESQADESVQSVTQSGRNLAELAVTTSLENANASLQLSFSCSETSAETSERCQFLSQVSKETPSGCDLLYQSLHHISSQELMTNICSSVEWKKQRESVLSDKYVMDNSIGLPLNSQGEFIPWHSSGKEGFNIKPSATKGSASSFQLLNFVRPNSPANYQGMKDKNYVDAELLNDKFKVLPMQNHQQESSQLSLSSKLLTGEIRNIGQPEVNWQDFVQRNSHSVCQLVSDVQVTDFSFQRCRQNHQTQNLTEREKIQHERNLGSMFPSANRQTMRLMGKDVTVGINNKDVQGSENGWRAAGTITENRFNPTVFDNPSLKRQFQQERILHHSGKPKETIIPSLKTQSSPSVGSTFPMKSADPAFSHQYLNWQMCSRQQNSLPLIRENASAKLNTLVHPLPFHALLNKNSNFQQATTFGTGSLKRSSEVPSAESTSFNAASQHMLLNSAQVNCNKRLPNGMNSAFHFPIVNQECQANVQQMWPDSSSEKLPQWLLNAKQLKEANLTSPQLYSGAIADHPCTISGTNFSAMPVYNTSVVSYPHDAISFQSRKESLTGPNLLFHPELIGAHRRCIPTSAINASHRNKVEDKDGEQSKHFNLIVPESVKLSKKRPADEAGNSPNAMKKPKLKIQGDPSSMREFNKRINVGGYAHCIGAVSDLDEFRDNTMDLGRSLSEIQHSGFRSSSDNSCYANCDTGVTDFDAFRDKVRGLGHSLPEIQKAGFRDTSCLKCLKQDGVIRAGPIKLSAGTKHILKPSHNMDHDQPRPTHSTVPFEAVTNSDKISEFQKSAAIYRF